MCIIEVTEDWVRGYMDYTVECEASDEEEAWSFFRDEYPEAEYVECEVWEAPDDDYCGVYRFSFSLETGELGIPLYMGRA